MPLPLVRATAINRLIDGCLIVLAMAAERHAGLLLGTALAIEFLSVGLAMTLALLRVGMRRENSFLLAVVICSPKIAGALAGWDVLAAVSPRWIELIPSAFCPGFFFSSSRNRSSKRHRTQEIPWITALFSAGIIVFLALQMTARES